jgi:uncharacterized protein (DUF433 family)
MMASLPDPAGHPSSPDDLVDAALDADGTGPRDSRRLDQMQLSSLVGIRPDVRSGRPCFTGTRVTVYDVLEYLASGMTAAEIVADFPELTLEHVWAAIEFAAVRERRFAKVEGVVRSEPSPPSRPQSVTHDPRKVRTSNTRSGDAATEL